MRKRDLSSKRSVECGACQASGLVNRKTCRICGGEGYIKKTRMASREVAPLSEDKIRKIDAAKNQ